MAKQLAKVLKALLHQTKQTGCMVRHYSAKKSKTQHIPQSIDTTGGQQAKLPPGEESFQGTENLTTPSKISCVAELEDSGCAPSSPRHLLGASPRKQQGVNQQRTSTQPTIDTHH